MARVNRNEMWRHSNWPEPWCSAWKAAIQTGDAFRPGGPATKLSPRSVWNDEMAFGRYYEFLSQHGLWDDGPCIDLDKLRAFAEHLAQTVSPYSVLANLSQVVAAVRLMDPKADLRDANRAIVRFASEVRPVRSVDDRLLSPVELISIGETMMAEADERPVHARWRAHLYRNGALIMAAALCPLRLRNWMMMRIDQHLDLATGRVSFKAHEMKRKRDMEFLLPPELLPPLRRYIEHFRPLLMKPGVVDEGYLWTSPTGGMTHRNALGIAVKAAIRKRAGKEFNFHLFRHASATFISEIAPERTRMASGVLHHSRLSTTDKYYIKGRKRQAFRRFQQAVKGIIAKGRRKRSRRPQKRRRSE